MRKKNEVLHKQASVLSGTRLRRWFWVFNKKLIKLNVLSSFVEASEFKGWYGAIDREYKSVFDCVNLFIFIEPQACK